MTDQQQSAAAKKRIVFDIVYLDGRRETVKAGPADYVAFERQYETGLGEMATARRFEYVAFIAWSCINRRTKGAIGHFEDWLQTIDDVEETEDDAVPLALTASPASSESSPSQPASPPEN